MVLRSHLDPPLSAITARRENSRRHEQRRRRTRGRDEEREREREREEESTGKKGTMEKKGQKSNYEEEARENIWREGEFIAASGVGRDNSVELDWLHAYCYKQQPVY